MKKKLLHSLLAVVSSLSILIMGVAPAFASSGTAEAAEGETERTPDHRPPGYYISHNDNGWNVMTHGPGGRHNFKARLHTDGVFTSLEGLRLEDVDSYAVLDGGQTLVLDFKTYNGVDGMNFSIEGGSCVGFDLQLNGRPVSTEKIYMGPEGRHPESNPFRECRG